MIELCAASARVGSRVFLDQAERKAQMSSIRGHVEVETWFVEDLIAATTKEINSKKEITIPKFQRGLVWNKKKQEGLIESIKKGYPIGTLLLYEVSVKANNTADAVRSYNLIDGLQRSHALKEYSKSPNNFFAKDDIEDSFLEALSAELDIKSDVDQDKLRDKITDWVKGVVDFTQAAGWETADLMKHLVREFLEIREDSNDYYPAVGKILSNTRVNELVARFLDSIKDQSDISKVKIPVIVFTGGEEHLPSVFALLNTKGTVLSRYEVFAAQWGKETEQRINNKHIREEIWKKYEALEDESFTSDDSEDTPSESSKKNREYTLFEYLFGLGQFLSDRFPRLFEEKANNRPSSAGFNLLTSCVGLRISEMKELPERLRGIDRNQLENHILEATRFVDDSLFPVLSVKQHGRKRVSIYHTEYQIVSMIAVAFQARYTLRGVSETDGWKTSWDEIRKNILMYYLYDVLREFWRGSGDSKLWDYMESKRYLATPIHREAWGNTLDSWFVNNQIPLLHKGRHIKDDRSEILFLKFIYAQKLSVMKNSRPYHVEHIISVNQLKKLKAQDERMPINMVGNLALLEPKINLMKGDLTFVEFLRKQLRNDEISEKQYADSLKQFEKQLLCKHEMIPAELTKSSYDDFLTARFDLLKKIFLKDWRDYIPGDPKT